MSLPAGFYAVATSEALPPSQPVFVRARYVTPPEQWNSLGLLGPLRRFDQYPRLVLYGGPTIAGLDAQFQRIMTEHARSLPPQTPPGSVGVPPSRYSTIPGPPVPIFRFPNTGTTYPWPHSDFAWSWDLEWVPPGVQTHRLVYGEHERAGSIWLERVT